MITDDVDPFYTACHFSFNYRVKDEWVFGQCSLSAHNENSIYICVLQTNSSLTIYRHTIPSIQKGSKGHV